MTISRTVCLGFIAVILVGTILLELPFSTSSGNWNSPLVALFTSTSAVCVTGLNVVDPGSHFSFFGQLIIMLLIQVGGLGYMTMNTLLMILLRRKFDLRQKLAIQESFDRPFLQGSRNLIKSIVAITLIFELTATFILIPFFGQQYNFRQATWLALFHSVSAFNNAGFGLFKDNFISYNSSIVINIVIALLIIFGGIGYQVIIEFYLWFINRFKDKRRNFDFSLNYKVVVSTTIFLLIFGTLALFFVEYHNPDTIAGMNFKDKFLAAWFQSVVSRTAGFNTIDIGKMTLEGLLIIMGLMFVGAGPGGTGGGVKVTTFRILSSSTRAVLQGKEEVVLYQREVPIPLILKAIAVIFGSVIAIIAASLAISMMENDFNGIQILFEVISAFATVGLSTGITGALSPISQLVIIVMMYIGRVGVVLLMAAIVGDPKPNVINFPEENLLVG
ncbi:TrkH family potassium uptake protein [Chroococcus sp. FPU101]|uniref:TrkH family potassium uptake protein n=1 Tax=Chroococcus sp. FPU101 TaxID=1974212 RepID=UPI001A8FF388|nr:TrkH family potassium uptake protein [Chroococcus sp. FPU101]GFE71009.1 Trk system potassium uptake protein [Chroococcus sp. FPU101]